MRRYSLKECRDEEWSELFPQAVEDAAALSVNVTRSILARWSSSDMQNKPFAESLLGIPIHVVDFGEVAVCVNHWIKERHRPSAYIVQANALSLVSAQDDSLYNQAIKHADLAVPDGMPLVWLLRGKRNQVKGRVYGPDLMLHLCENAARYKWRCFLYGGKPGVPELLADVLIRRFPGLAVVGTLSPPFRPLTESEEENIRATINETRPDIIWVGLGGPKQDIWMHENRNALDVSVIHGVGAAVEQLHVLVVIVTRDGDWSGYSGCLLNQDGFGNDTRL